MPAGLPHPGYHIPGYTGHLHGDQHVIAKTYGDESRLLFATVHPKPEYNIKRGTTEGSLSYRRHTLTPLATARRSRPVDEEEDHYVPGYTGHIHGCQDVYGKTYADMTRDLISTSTKPLERRKDYVEAPFVENSASLPVQPKEFPKSSDHTNREIHTDKRRVKPGNGMEPNVAEYEDFYRDTLQDQHHVPGYTGHLHQEQHVFALPYGLTSHILRSPTRGPDPVEEPVKPSHFIPGYTGHLHGDQHVFARTYSEKTRALLPQYRHLRSKIYAESLRPGFATISDQRLSKYPTHDIHSDKRLFFARPNDALERKTPYPDVMGDKIGQVFDENYSLPAIPTKHPAYATGLLAQSIDAHLLKRDSRAHTA